MKDIPWADLLCCDWCKKSFTSLQVCFLRPDMNICPLAFKKRPQWRAEAVFQREIGCFVNLWHGFWNSIFMRENENKQRDPSYLHGEDLQTDDWPSWISPPTTASSAFVKESTGATRSLFHILSHLIPWKTSCFAEMFQQSMDWGNIGFCFRLNHPFLPPQNIHSFMFWNNQHTYLSWFLPSSKGHAVDAFYEEALFPTLGDWKSCCGIRSITGLTLMATEHAGVKFHFSPSLSPTHKWCPLPTPNTPLPHSSVPPSAFAAPVTLQNLPAATFSLLSAGRRHLNALLSVARVPSWPAPSPTSLSSSFTSTFFFYWSSWREVADKWSCCDCSLVTHFKQGRLQVWHRGVVLYTEMCWRLK